MHGVSLSDSEAYPLHVTYHPFIETLYPMYDIQDIIHWVYPLCHSVNQDEVSTWNTTSNLCSMCSQWQSYLNYTSESLTAEIRDCIESNRAG